MPEIFLDNASTTKVDPEVVETMLPFFTTCYGNPSSIHRFGRKAREAVDKAREQVGALLGAKKDELIFTCGGTESDNLAIKGVVCPKKDLRGGTGPHVITSAIEHPGVLEPCRYLQSLGYDVAFLPVDSTGIVSLDDLQDTITDRTVLVSIMMANNEVGTVEPIAEIGKIAHDHGALFHTDAVQGVGKLPVDVRKMNIDLLSLSAHKIYGPKGIGALYCRNGIKLEPLLHGGGHEKGLRSGTLNVPSIVGLGKACQLAKERLPTDSRTMQTMRDLLITRLSVIEESYLNGHPTKRIPNNAHFRFTAVEGESLLLSLDEKGVAASTGSACSSQKLQASHVLLALGLSPVDAHGSIRLSVGRTTTQDEIDYVTSEFPGIVERLRQMSPLWNR